MVRALIVGKGENAGYKKKKKERNSQVLSCQIIAKIRSISTVF